MTERRDGLLASVLLALAACGSQPGSANGPPVPGPVDWSQWGGAAAHQGAVSVSAQTPTRILADLTLDPFAPQEDQSYGALVVHYAVPLLGGSDVFVTVKGGRFTPCPGGASSCTGDAWNSQTWSERRLVWSGDSLVERWTWTSDWKPLPSGGELTWEPVFQAALVPAYVYVPARGGAIAKVDRERGTEVARIDPFHDSSTWVAGPLTVDARGNVYYHAIQLDPVATWSGDLRGAFLVRVAPDDTATAVPWSSLVPGAPAASSPCETSFTNAELPWPPAPEALPATRPCGGQRPGVNVAPAVGEDGTVYSVSRAHFNSRYAYVIAVGPDLHPRWAASLRDRLADGCGTSVLPPSGAPGGCRAGARTGVDPATNGAPAGRVLDNASSSPVVAPDGSVLYGAYTRYNASRGHLFRFGPTGDFVGSFDFGWDVTPAIYRRGATWSVVLKDNHYESGSYCNEADVCPAAEGGPFRITQLSPDLVPEWSFIHTNTLSCERRPDGSMACVSDHPHGNEWCINAPVVDADGTVYGLNEDGNLWVIGQGGTLRGQVFLDRKEEAAYTPLAIGREGRIYAQNFGRLFVLGH
jgi:hypothetical protein